MRLTDKETKEKIGRLTRRDFDEDEIYTFPVTLCHNDIDRDGERFSEEALAEMAPLFIGKTGIFDHAPSAVNQMARIYDTEVVTDDSRTTQLGTPYQYLKGYAYMIRTAENADTITLIDGGILKEVSVSCSASRRTCSVCGAAGMACGHVKGEVYDGKHCHTVLSGITDAYEWSFVAVPAQVGAGVMKQYKGGTTMEDFTPITTQEALTAAAQPLIEAAITEAVKQYEGYLSPEAHQKALDEQAAAHKTALLAALRTKAAMQAGLPVELADRLTGETEDALCKDAEKLAALTKSAHGSYHFSAENGEADGVSAAFYKKNPKLARKEN